MAGPATFSFAPDHMSDIKWPVKNTSLYKVCQNLLVCQTHCLANVGTLLMMGKDINLASIYCCGFTFMIGLSLGGDLEEKVSLNWLLRAEGEV